MKRKFILSILVFSTIFSAVGCNKCGDKSNTDMKESVNKFPEMIVVKEKGKEREVKISQEQSKKLSEEIDKLLKSGTDKPYESKFSDLFKFGKYEVLFDFDDLRNREKNNAQIKETMEADVKEHRAGGVSEEIIEKKFGKEGSKIRTTGTVALDINGKGYSIFNDEPIVNLLVEILVK